MSGHSKWANIKHKKGRADAKRGKTFTRISKEITIAAREGGGDPDANPRLRLAVLNGRAENMPSENIKRAIQRGTGEIEGVNYEEITYEGYAPSGVAVILEAVTDNRNRTVAELRSQFSKLGGNLGESNSVAWNFMRKGVIYLKPGKLTEDQLMEYVLDSGAEDMEYDSEASKIITPVELYSQCVKFFEEKGLEIKESKLEYIPKDPVLISNVNDARKIIKFIENFEDHDDVQNVYSNFEIDDSIADQLESDD